MKIAFDTSPLTNSQHAVRGVGSYISNLKNEFEKIKKLDIIFTNDISEIDDADVIHTPYFDPFRRTVPEAGHGKLIITIHDLIPQRFPDHFPSGIKGRVMWEVQKRKLKNIDAIITDSKASKSDIVKYAKLTEDKIHIIPLAADSTFRVLKNSKTKLKGLISKHKLPEEFALYVGDVTWNKNLPSLIKATVSKNIPLVIAGKAITNKDFDRENPWNHDLIKAQELIKDSENIFTPGFVTNEELVSLYNAASLLAFPSRYEGFGLPVLEAMQCGTPVVTTRAGSIPEVAQDAAFYVEANSIKDIAGGIEKVFHDKKIQKDLSEKGLKQAKKFSWKETASQTLEVYERVHKGTSS